MGSIGISLIIFLCVSGGAMLGMFLRSVLPEHHLDDDSKDVIKLGMGLIATITALVLGLVIATAKSSYDAQDAAVKHTSAKILLLDRVLDQYGPETKEIRNLLRHALARRVAEIWPQEKSEPVKLDTSEAVASTGVIEKKIQQLSPHTEIQRTIHLRAIQIVSDIMETRWLAVGSTGSSVPSQFLAIVVFWLMFIFACFGIFAPRNSTVVAVLFLCALSTSGAIFLILEMDQPFSGVMKISSSPLRYALAHLGQ